MRRRALAPLLALTVSATALLAGCGGGGVPTLGPDASPEVVVATYLAAAQSGDAATARSLMTPEHAEQHGTGATGGRLSDVLIGEPLSIGGSGEGEGPGSTSGGRSEVSVRVDARVTGADASVPDGDLTWFVGLVREGGGPWLVSGEGTGP